MFYEQCVLCLLNIIQATSIAKNSRVRFTGGTVLPNQDPDPPNKTKITVLGDRNILLLLQKKVIGQVNLYSHHVEKFQTSLMWTIPF